MAFNVIWHNNARKFLRQLQKGDSERIVKKMQSVQEDPFRYLEHFEGDNSFKLRIGDFRLLIDVKLDRRLLVIKVLDKRGRIYKR